MRNERDRTSKGHDFIIAIESGDKLFHIYDKHYSLNSRLSLDG
jgi:hypothetical protein